MTSGRPDVAEARRQLAEWGRLVSRGGMVPGTSGNISIRVDDGMVITRRGADLGSDDLSASPHVRFGSALEASALTPEPSSETPMHASIHRRLDTGAIVHTHSMAATVVSTLVDEVPPIHYYMARLGDSLRVAPYATFGSAELAGYAVAALEDRRGALLGNHGAIAIGDTLAEAYRNAELIEWLCEVYLRALSAGRPRILEAGQLDAVRAQSAAPTLLTGDEEPTP